MDRDIVIEANPEGFCRTEQQINELKSVVCEIIKISELPDADELVNRLQKMSANEFDEYFASKSPLGIPPSKVSPTSHIYLNFQKHDHRESNGLWINLYNKPNPNHYSKVGATKVVCIFFPDQYRLMTDTYEDTYIMGPGYIELLMRNRHQYSGYRPNNEEPTMLKIKTF